MFKKHKKEKYPQQTKKHCVHTIYYRDFNTLINVQCGYEHAVQNV